VFGNYHALLGHYQGQPVLLAMSYGAAMTSELVHLAGLIGTPVVLQLGSFGGLRAGMRVGDLFFPDLAARREAASDCYLPPDVPADASPDLLAWLRREATQRGLTDHTGPHVTTAAMLAETRDDISRWNNEGFWGVDLETATTFAVARHFGMRRAAALVLIDNLIEDHSLFDLTTDQRGRYWQTQDAVARLALDALLAWSDPDHLPHMVAADHT
jgi:uridine phosphorylase